MYDKIKAHLKENTACVIAGANGELYLSHNGNKTFQSASLIKLYILAYALEKDDVKTKLEVQAVLPDGELYELGAKEIMLDELLYMMIGSSDNGATNLLIQRYGFQALNEFITGELKLRQTSISREMLDYKAIENGKDNYTSACDVYFILKKLYKGAGAKYLASAKCLDRIMRYIYHDCCFYGKAGSVQSSFHDSGVLTVNNREIFVVFMSDNYNDARRACGLAGITAKEILKGEPINDAQH